MVTKPIDDDLNASWFYGLATVASILFSWEDVVELFAGEALAVRCFGAWFMYQITDDSFGTFVNGLHCWFVDRLGPLVGVVTTMLLVVVLVRGSLMIAVHAKTESAQTQQSQVGTPND